MAVDVEFAAMTPLHLNRIMEIEQACFTTPWSKNTFYRELVSNPYATYTVAMVAEEVVGYAGTWLVLDESHVTNIAVAPEWRRQGVARKLLDHLLAISLQQGAVSMTLEVRRSNAAAQNLYEEFGFVVAGVRKGYYTDDKEDALIMWLRDIPAYFDRKEQAHG